MCHEDARSTFDSTNSLFTSAALLLAAFLVGCGSTAAPSPFAALDAGVDGDAAIAEAAAADHAPDMDVEVDEGGTLWGGPCADDTACDDHLDCTRDECDRAAGLCHFVPDDTRCDNGRYCDGIERCDARVGCAAGVPEACSDGLSCTIDQCVEATRSCEHLPRDADGDGDPDGHCSDGHDCDDSDPLVSSLASEICDNGKDDDCDGQVDEDDCQRPAHDTCLAPLLVGAPGTYALSTKAAGLDYAGTCTPQDAPALRDVIAAITVPDGPPRDVDVVAVASAGHLAIGLASVCGNPATELSCGAGASATGGGTVARIRGRALPPGNYPLYVWSDQDGTITLHVTFEDPVPKPANETCATAISLPEGTDATVELVDAAHDLASGCAQETGDLVWSFSVDETQDVHVRAASLDGDGTPSLSLRTGACTDLADELVCSNAPTSSLFWRALPPGTYFLAVSATAPTVVTFRWESTAPTVKPADESCDGAPHLDANQTKDVDLSAHTDDIKLGCVGGFVDAAYALSLDETSDVLLVERISEDDSGAIELALPACKAPSDMLACGVGATSPVRASRKSVPAGEYRVVVEGELGNPATVTAFVRKSVAPTLVAFADTCDDAFAVPEGGGLFQGNTSNANADYGAGCDSGGGDAAGAPDQILQLTLHDRKRVVLDMSGSSYITLLDVRSVCAGKELLLGCSVGYSTNRSYFDQVLEPGTYFLQIDGFSGESGPWILDARVVDP